MSEPHFKRIAEKLFRARYASGVLLDDMAAEFGLCKRAVYRRAKMMGLTRGYATMKPAITPGMEAEFTAMWQARVAVAAIALHVGVDAKTVNATVRRLGLMLRGRGRHPTITVAQFIEAQIGTQMARTARIEQAAILNADMADSFGFHRRVGEKHARGVA